MPCFGRLLEIPKLNRPALHRLLHQHYNRANSRNLPSLVVANSFSSSLDPWEVQSSRNPFCFEIRALTSGQQIFVIGSFCTLGRQSLHSWNHLSSFLPCSPTKPNQTIIPKAKINLKRAFACACVVKIQRIPSQFLASICSMLQPFSSSAWSVCITYALDPPMHACLGREMVMDSF